MDLIDAQQEHSIVMDSSVTLYLSVIEPVDDGHWKPGLADFVIMSGNYSRQNIRQRWADETMFPLTQRQGGCWRSGADQIRCVYGNRLSIRMEADLLWKLQEDDLAFPASQVDLPFPFSPSDSVAL